MYKQGRTQMRIWLAQSFDWVACSILEPRRLSNIASHIKRQKGDNTILSAKFREASHEGKQTGQTVINSLKLLEITKKAKGTC